MKFNSDSSCLNGKDRSHKSFQRKMKEEKEDWEKASVARVDLQDGPKNSKGARIWCQDFPCEGQGKQQH